MMRTLGANEVNAVVATQYQSCQVLRNTINQSTLSDAKLYTVNLKCAQHNSTHTRNKHCPCPRAMWQRQRQSGDCITQSQVVMTALWMSYGDTEESNAALQSSN